MSHNGQAPPERFSLTDRPGHDVHWTLALICVRKLYTKHNATFAAAVKEWYGAPAKTSGGGLDEPWPSDE